MKNTNKQPQNLNTGKSSGFGTGTTANAGTGRPGIPNPNMGKTTAQPQKTGKQAWNQNQGKPGMGQKTDDDDRSKGGQGHR